MKYFFTPKFGITGKIGYSGAAQAGSNINCFILEIGISLKFFKPSDSRVPEHEHEPETKNEIETESEKEVETEAETETES